MLSWAQAKCFRSPLGPSHSTLSSKTSNCGKNIFTFPPEYFLSAIATTTTVIFLVSQPCNFHMEVTATSVSANAMQKDYLPESCPVATGITLYGDLEELERVDVSSAEIAACISHRHSLRNITEL